MPRLNRTGPAGQGPMTGRGLGPCGGSQAYVRRGSGRGRGFGWRRFWRYYPTTTPTKKEEEVMLVEEIEILEEEIQSLKSRLAQIKDQK